MYLHYHVGASICERPYSHDNNVGLYKGVGTY
nr:MAG TPA: hypothetical protein [Caudoviricetes sp.]